MQSKLLRGEEMGGLAAAAEKKQQLLAARQREWQAQKDKAGTAPAPSARASMSEGPCLQRCALSTWHCLAHRSAGCDVVGPEARAAMTATLPLSLQRHIQGAPDQFQCSISQEAAKAQRIVELEQAKAAARGKFSSLQVGWRSGDCQIC